MRTASVLLATALLSALAVAAPLDLRGFQLQDAEPTYQTPIDGATKFGRFWHITDIHLDLHYLPGSHPSTQCHRVISPPSAENLPDALIGDSGSGDNPTTPIDQSTVAGVFGAPGTTCDSPAPLLEHTLDFIQKQAQANLRPDFVVITGDFARHDPDKALRKSWPENVALCKYIAAAIREVIPPEIPVVPSLGNNDVVPHNVVLPNSTVLAAFADVWSDFIPESQQATFREIGAYSTEVPTSNLTVFALNTLFWFVSNDAVQDCEAQPASPGASHLDWLERELERIQRQGRKALLTGHVPPVRGNWYTGCARRFARLVAKYNAVIVGQLYGHVNLDHFVLLDADSPDPSRTHITDLTGWVNPFMSLLHSVATPSFVQQYREQIELGLRALLARRTPDPVALARSVSTADDIADAVNVTGLSLALVSPSVIPNYMPTLRLFEYAPDRLLDYVQYRLNLTALNARPDDDQPVVDYTPTYRASAEYGFDPQMGLTVRQYIKLARDMIFADSDDPVFVRHRDAFWKHFVVDTGAGGMPI